MFDGAAFRNHWKAEDDHDIVDEFNLHSQFEQDGGAGYLFAQIFGIDLDDGVAEVVEQIQKAVIKGQDEALCF